MLLLELEETIIKPLSIAEKLQLIADIAKMLQEEESRLMQYVQQGVEYPVFTPTISPDESSYHAAYQLQQLLEGGNV
ncbi:hypothetical protein U14_01379 [Candidatus Moduliflexus flocculans]|uniref:Uncharacterized protein n=1 Tax=Candidatus Moduliflexus flocculans TaxID=1499966 RepID=A0A0S6VRV9_9BACT|nr:hypothetical protein U14_01379 [Candidatus Moduliflexus flocculans]